MNSEIYQEGSTVQGIERIFPTKVSKALLIFILTATPSSFFGAYKFSGNIFKNLSEFEKILFSLTVCEFVFAILAIVIIVDLLIIVNSSRHGRINHFSNSHPNMSFKWLYKNASSKHWIFITSIFTIGVLIGVIL